MLRTPAPAGGDERGSVPIAVMVITVLTLSLGGTMVAVNGGLELSRNDQNRTNAFQLANAGIDQALYRIDSDDLPTTGSGSYVPTLSGSRVVSFTDSITVGGSTFAIVATKTPVTQDRVWQVRSTGTDSSGRRRLAIATIEAVSLFPEGFFTFQEFTLTGNQDAPVAYRSSTCPTAAPSCEINPVPGALGTNATIDGADATYATFVARWQVFKMYGRATQEAADLACGGSAKRCGTSPKVQAVTDQRQVETPDMPDSGMLSCNGGLITGTISPGDYVCDDVTFLGTISVSGSGRARFWVDGDVVFAAGSVVNRHQPPSRLQVFQEQQPTVGGSVCDAEVWALLYTPSLAIDCTGDHQPAIWGAVVANIHGGTGNHFDFHWDLDSTDAVGNAKFVVKNWRECPPGALDC